MKRSALSIKGALKKADIQLVAVIIMIVIICTAMSFVYDGFLSLYNIKAMLMAYVPEGIIALGLTLVIISGGIDLSVAGVMPFTAIVYCLMIKSGVKFPTNIASTCCKPSGIACFRGIFPSRRKAASDNLYDVFTTDTSLFFFQEKYIIRRLICKLSNI